MANALNHDQLEALFVQINQCEPDCRVKISELRKEMDAACDQRTISTTQWRSLLERISILQARLVRLEPDAWRQPPVAY